MLIVDEVLIVSNKDKGYTTPLNDHYQHISSLGEK